MSKIFDFENQFILRLPEDLAEKVSQQLENPQKTGENPQKLMELQPYIEKNEENGRVIETLKFKYIRKTEVFLIFKRFSYEDFEGVGNLVDLPCIVESQKTLDSLNFFKSNDISQMIVINKDNAEFHEKSRRIARKICGTQRKYSRFLSLDGITAPTKNIRKRFFRKKFAFLQYLFRIYRFISRVLIDKPSVREVEGSLNEIIKVFY